MLRTRNKVQSDVKKQIMVCKENKKTIIERQKHLPLTPKKNPYLL